jgi:zinc protease
MRALTRACLLFLALAAPCAAAPQASVTAEANVGAPRAGGAQVVRKRLSNGLEVVLQEDTTSSEIAVCLTLRAGSREEPPDRAGTAALLAELLGTRGGSASEVHVGVDEVQFLERVPARQLEAALALQAERMHWPAPSAEVVAGAAEALAARVASGHAGSSAAEARVRELAFQGDWAYAHAPVPSAAALRAVQPDWLRAFFDANVGPQNAVVSVVGPFDAAQALPVIQRTLARLPRAPAAPSANVPSAPSRQTSERLNVLSAKDAEVPRVFFAWVVPNSASAEARALALAGWMLARAGGGRLRAKLMGEAEIAQEVSASLLEQAGPSMFTIQVGLRPRANVDQVRRVLQVEIARLATMGPSAAELAAAKAEVAGDFTEQLASAAARALELGRELSAGATSLLAPPELDPISADAVRAAVRRYLPEHSRTSVEVYPPAWAQDEPKEEKVADTRRTHVVKPGENISNLARRYDTNAAAIARDNKIDESGVIVPGQTLVIPDDPPEKTSYVVRPGDTLIGIAKRFGTTSAAIIRENRLREGQGIRSGQRLTLPREKKAPAQEQP